MSTTATVQPPAKPERELRGPAWLAAGGFPTREEVEPATFPGTLDVQRRADVLRLELELETARRERDELLALRALGAATYDKTPGTGASKRAAALRALGIGGAPRGPEGEVLRPRQWVVENRPFLHRWYALTRDEAAAGAGKPLAERLADARRIAMTTLVEECKEDCDTTHRRLREVRDRLRKALAVEHDASWRGYYTMQLAALTDKMNPAFVPDGKAWRP